MPDGSYIVEIQLFKALHSIVFPPPQKEATLQRRLSRRRHVLSSGTVYCFQWPSQKCSERETSICVLCDTIFLEKARIATRFDDSPRLGFKATTWPHAPESFSNRYPTLVSDQSEAESLSCRVHSSEAQQSLSRRDSAREKVRRDIIGKNRST